MSQGCLEEIQVLEAGSCFCLDQDLHRQKVCDKISCKAKINQLSQLNQYQWHLCVMVITTAQLHSKKPELKFCVSSNPACCVSEILDGENSTVEIRLMPFFDHHHHQLIWEHIATFLWIKNGRSGTSRKTLFSLWLLKLAKI